MKIRILQCFIAFMFLHSMENQAQTAVHFDAEKTTWHGFDRYDYLMDTTTLSIEPFKAKPEEGTGMDDKLTPQGKVRCIVVIPQTPAAGNPYTWRGFYWDHEPQSEVALLKLGFFVAYININTGRQWEAWYQFLLSHGLSSKPSFSGMSRGGINEYTWAAMHPDRVASLYADNPAIRPESFAKLKEMVQHDIPILSIVGSMDFLLPANTLAIEEAYLRFGGRMTMMIKEGTAHHPHSIREADFIATWVVSNTQPAARNPLFADTSLFNRTYYYSLENQYYHLKPEKTYATVRGPGFSPVYDVYTMNNSQMYGTKGWQIIAPIKPAAGNPWVIRADRVLERTARIEQSLLEKGYYIVIPPITAQSGEVAKEWDDFYHLVIQKGFSRKPVLIGTGAYGGEVYAWAINNPDNVSAIYVDNVLMQTLMEKTQPLDHLAPLAKASVPVLHVSGAEDPWLATNTRVAEKKYKALGGKITVIVIPGEGHFPRVPRNPAPIIDFILKNTKE